MLKPKEINLIGRYYCLVSEIFRPYGIEMCLIGGWAVKYYSNPPATLDFDFLCSKKLFDVVQDRFEFSRIYPTLKFDNHLDVKITEEPNLIRLGFPILWLKHNNIRIDLFSADTSFRKSVLDRAENITPDIRVASLMDIMAFKIISNRAKDRKHFNLLQKKYRLNKDQLAEIDELADIEMTER